MNTKKKVLVTGAAGFIGSNLMARCIELGWDVTGIDDMSNGHAAFLPKSANYLIRDFAADDVLQMFRNQRYDAVIHLAAMPRVSYSIEDPVGSNDTNVTKTLKLIDACKNTVKRFVFASSSSVYGNAEELPTYESDAKSPQSPYALQKSIIEEYLKQFYHHYKGMDYVALRFFNVFGPNQLGSSPYSTALSSWLTAIKSGKPMRRDGDGTQTRDLVYVDNVVDAIIKSVLVEHDLCDVINVGSGSRVSNNDILEFLLARYPGSTFVDAPVRPGDVKHTHASIRKAEILLGYKPRVKIWPGIERTCRWYDENWDWIKNLNNTV